MKPTSFLRYAALSVIILVLLGKETQAQPIRFEPPVMRTNGFVELRLTAPVNKAHRVEVSTDLSSWTPLVLLENTNTLKVFTVPPSTGPRFYRAIEQGPGFHINSIEPAAAFPGEEIVIHGVFTLPPADTDKIVRFGADITDVTQASEFQWRVIVPQQAQSGSIKLLTATTNTESDEAFTVLGTTLVTVIPPSGMQATQFTVVNTFGGMITNNGTNLLPVRNDFMTVNMAVDDQTNIFLYAISLAGGQPITLSMESTAQALVFLCPAFASLDPLIASRTMQLIRTNAKVLELAALLDPLYTQPGDPFTNATVIAKYEAAVRSVAGLAEAAGLNNMGGRSPASFSGPSVPSGDYPLDLQYTKISPRTEAGVPLGAYGRRMEDGAGPVFPYANPVDWLVVIEEIDAAAAFPQGKIDFERTVREKRRMELFPHKSFKANASVAAELLTERLNPVKFGMKKLLKAIQETISPPESIQFPERDGVYVLRSIGPGINDTPERDFVFDNYREERIRAAAANLVAVTMDIVGLLIDVEAIGFDGDAQELIAKMTLEINKAAPNLKEPSDLGPLALDLGKFFLQEIADKLVQDGSEGAPDFARKKKASKGFVKAAGILKTVGKTLNVADKIGGAGQIFQRELGILQTTPMETALILIGEPFKLDTTTITPTLASPGSEVQINFQSTSVSRMFDTTLPIDTVFFDGPDPFEGEILEVTGTTNNQTLRVKIPATLGVAADGQYSMFVNIQGRRGSAAFQLLSVPSITEVTPLTGFAAVDDFLGAPFSGSQLRVKGALFTSTSQFFFGGAGSPEVTSKIGGTGNLQIRIPKNAQSAVLRLLHQGTNVLGPLITVFKQPIIDSVTPTNGIVGTPVEFTVRDIGVDPNLVRVQFSGATPGTVSVSANGVVKTIVPSSAVTGPLTVLTPGGSATTNFVVDPGVPSTNTTGGTISVGGSSVVTLQRAIMFAMSDAFPSDDGDGTNDPPYEEGDFVTQPVGAAYNDVIAITGLINGNVNFPGGYGDNYTSGGLTGNTTIPAVGTRFSGITFLGPVVITGKSNFFSSCTFSNTVTIVGSGNTFSGSGVIAGQLVLEGDYNTIGSGPIITFRNTPSHAAIIRGHHNRINSSNFYTNSGDGVRVEGGTFNYININRSRGNGGNGITLTGGAAYNEVAFLSGVPAGGAVAYNSGNAGHGIALIGDAHDNSIYGLGDGAAGNGIDGAYLDGPGVVRNRLASSTTLRLQYNGRNGVTFTNGASNNQMGTPNIDSSPIYNYDVRFNKGNGVVIANAPFTAIAVQARSNLLNGVIVSAVTNPPSGTLLILVGTDANGQAGLRLEKGTTGVRAEFTSQLRTNGIGVELDGTNVQGNVLNGFVNGSLSDGVVLRGAHRNDLRLNVENCAGSGIVLIGAQKNIIRVNGIENNQGDGIRLTGGSENQLIASFGNRVLGNQNGIVFEQATSRNMVTDLSVQNNRGHGILIDGLGTTKNTFLETDILGSALDGLRIQNQASTVSFGVVTDSPFGAVRTISLHNNTNAAIRITGDGTRDISITGCFISPQGAGSQPAGIIIENNAAEVTLTHNTFFRNGEGLIIKDGAHAVTLHKSIVESNTTNGILISNGSDVSIGGVDPAFGNTLYSNLTAIKLTGSAVRNCQIQNNVIYDNTDGIHLEQRVNANLIGPGNVLDRNLTGITVDFSSTNTFFENTIRGGQNAGISLESGASDNRVTGNTIVSNSIGVFVTGAASVRNSIFNNSITANGGNGIGLALGGNTEIEAPEFEEVQGDAITGTSTAPDGSRVQIFQDPGLEGESLLTSAQVINGRFRAPIEIEPWKVGLLFNVSATVTDPAGNTSQFNSKSPDGDERHKIVFTSTRDGNSEIYMIAPPSASPVNISQHPTNDHSPSLGGSCNEVVFVSDRTGNPDLFIQPADSIGSARQLINHPSNDYDPEWLIPCTNVVFVSDRDGNPEIYKVNADGNGLTRLTTHSATDRNPSPAARGTKILFESDRSGILGLWIMNADGSSPQPLTASTFVDTQPVMSPDGVYVAFVSQRDGNSEIYVMKTDGSNLLRLTSNAVVDKDPAWSPDSSSIVFASYRGGGAELFVVSRTGGIPQPITIGAGDNTQPSLDAD